MYDVANKSNLLKNCDILIHLILEKQERIGFHPNKRNLPSHCGSTEWDGAQWGSVVCLILYFPYLGMGACNVFFIPRNALV